MSEIKSKLFIFMITVGIVALFYVPSTSYEMYVGPDCNELDLVNLPHFGTKVAFVSNMGSSDPDNFSLFTINSDGTGPISNLGDLYYRDPVLISSDEKIIVFTRLVNDTNQVFVGNTDGTQIRQITHDDQPKSVLAITPDGKNLYLAGASAFPGNDLYFMASHDNSADFGSLIKLNNDVSNTYSPNMQQKMAYTENHQNPDISNAIVLAEVMVPIAGGISVGVFLFTRRMR